MTKAMTVLTLGALLAGCATTGAPVAGAPTMAEPKVSAVKYGQIVLAPNRKLVVRIDNQEMPTQVEETFDKPADIPLPAGSPDKETWAALPTEGIPQVKVGYVSFHLWSDAKKGVVLIMTNGTDRGLVYVANIVTREGAALVSTPTTICSVRPGGAGAEIWPEGIVAIEVIKILKAKEPLCLDPDAGGAYRPGDQPPSAPASRPPAKVEPGRPA